jgi:hypothetical protein
MLSSWKIQTAIPLLTRNRWWNKETLDNGPENLDQIVTIYGGDDYRTFRAQEFCNHLQRFRWALEHGDAVPLLT